MCSCSCVGELRVAVTLSRNFSKLAFFADFSKSMSSEAARQGWGGSAQRSVLQVNDSKKTGAPNAVKTH